MKRRVWCPICERFPRMRHRCELYDVETRQRVAA